MGAGVGAGAGAGAGLLGLDAVILPDEPAEPVSPAGADVSGAATATTISGASATPAGAAVTVSGHSSQ
ncbi:MAG: hypothetical protein CVT59_04165 [Actinobacteria bacterium HGW-Actinobacteria-1]|nr:MAG: hypothetical protein CVT59_04165 [Actinobacteria bacterium HGW-Actinobacteria-1]